MMGTCTEQIFGVVPVKSSKRMERTHGNKRRALIFGYSTQKDIDTNVTTTNSSITTTPAAIPIKTCWVLRQQEHQAVHHYQQQYQRLHSYGGDNNHNRNSLNSRLSSSPRNSDNNKNDNKNFRSAAASTAADSSDNCKRKRVGGAPSVCQLFPSHVFRESSLIVLIIISIFSAYLIRPGNGLHPPQCQWSLYQDIERLNCLVEAGNSLIVEEEVHGIGPEHAKSLWVQCASTFSDIQPSTSSGNSANINRADSSYYSPSSSALGTEGVQQHHHHHQHHHGGGGSSSGGGSSNNNNANPGFVLTQGVFMAVPNLRDLRLENCKLAGITPGSLSYLPYLQNLTIRAHTSLTSWPSTNSLEIKAGVLQGLPLVHLDLSTTSLSSLPDDFLCFLPKLETLNLTRCFLRDFRFIVPSDPTNPNLCGSGSTIKKLDISGNEFTLLPPATFAAVSKLEELRIERNSITIAAERALLGVTSLKILSLSGNLLSSLPPQFFKDNRLLQEIYLQNNSLSVLAPGLFAGLKHLVVLDLSNNELTSEWVNGETFRGLDNLFALNLANNELTKIDSLLFRDLRFLQMLDLSNNKIQYISEDSFVMPNMYTLVLSHNHLKKIDSRICSGLLGLSFLSLDNNKIESVEADSFKNCSGLQDVNLSGNKLSQVPQALSVLTHLRTLDLGENNITDVGNASYQSLPNLYGLRLTDNSIQTIPNDSFNNLPSLKIVNLAKNNISKIAQGVFSNNANLQAVRLDSNRLSDITGLFKSIPNLLWLNISANQLEELKYEEFPQRLQWLDLRSNKIHTLGNCMDLENLRIRNLDLSDNYITEVGSSNLPDSIENLILGHNRIHQVQPYTFYRKPNLTRVDLSHNQLIRLDQNALRLGPDRAASVTPTAEVFLGHNPLECSCTMEWLQQMNSEETSGQYPIIQDVEDVLCTRAFDKMGFEPISYLTVKSSQFLCKYENHCFKTTCQCCNVYDACDCEMQCPKNCSCFHDQAWTTNVVDCSMGEQLIIPAKIPMDVTELYLDGNVFSSSALESFAFLGRKNLKALFLNASHIEVIQNRTFHGLKALKVLHLENNFIERLEGYEFEDLENLEELYLHQNSISWIANETFTSLYSLKVLWLHGNNFVDFPVWSATTRIGRLGYTLMDIKISGNEFTCACEYATKLKDWLFENRAKISDASQVICVDQVSSSSSSSSSSGHNNADSSNQIQHTSSGGGGGSGNGGQQNRTELVIVRLLNEKNHRCKSSSSSQSIDLSRDLSILETPTRTEYEKFNLAEYAAWLICGVLLILLLILISVMAYYWRKSLQVWLHSHCGIRLDCREASTDKDKLFDAFISYSSKDEAWVRQVLAAELERNDPPYRLCLRYRDLPSSSGQNYIADTIVQASEASKRTILVLSHHFLKGEWGRTEVKAGHHSILKDRHRKVIIVLLGDLPSKDLDPDIRLYLKSHIYLNAEDKNFFNRLRYSLPDVKVKAPVFRSINGRTSGRNSVPAASASGTPLQAQNHQFHHPAAHHYHYSHNQPSPNLSQAHHLTHLGSNNMTMSPPPPPLTAPPVPGLLANLPPNIPHGNGTIGPMGHPHHHGALHGGGPVTTVIGGGLHNGSMASISTNSNNSGSQRTAQRHHNLVNSVHHPPTNNSRQQNTAVHI